MVGEGEWGRKEKKKKRVRENGGSGVNNALCLIIEHTSITRCRRMPCYSTSVIWIVLAHSNNEESVKDIVFLICGNKIIAKAKEEAEDVPPT